MNTRLVKLIAAVGCTATAFGLSLTAKPVDVDLIKQAKPVASGSKEILISNPESPEEYGIGTYRVEGILAKNTKVRILLDDKEVKKLVTNSEDGQYDLDVKVPDAGNHELVVAYKNSEGKEVFTKLEFKASSKKVELIPDTDPDISNEEVKVTSSKNVPSEDTNEEETSSTLLPEDTTGMGDPNSSENRKASGVHDKEIKPEAKHKVKPKPKVSPPKSPQPTSAKGKFVISSHTNFNVVPSGIIKIGGKGNPGDKIMLLVDNKPSMRGTIKSNGRWAFPVKIAKPGFRKITAQDIRSREAKTIKLRIK